MSRPLKNPRGADEWLALGALAVYRWALAVAAGVIYVTGLAAPLFEVTQTRLFALACIAYLIVSLPAMAAAHLRRPRLGLQAPLLAAMDIAFALALVTASGGVGGGLAVLLVPPVAGAAVLLPRRYALLLAAIASLGLLAEEGWRQLTNVLVADWGPAGVFGLLLFVTVAVANILASRARSSAVLAAARQTELLDLTALNKRIVRHLAVGLLVVDAGNRVRLVNPAAQNLLGLGPEAVGQTLGTTTPRLARVLEAWRAAPGLAPEPMEIGESNALPHFVHLGPGAKALVLIFLEDSRAIDATAQQVKLAGLGRLTGAIAHEIRNPLSAISHAAQLIEESKQLAEEDRRLLAIIRRHTQRIDHMVEDVLYLGRRSHSRPTRIDLEHWLRQAIDDYRRGRAEAPAIELAAVPERLAVHADPHHLRQILDNLLDNAQRHARRPDTPLRIHIRAGRNAVGEPWLEVADNGPGFPAELVDKLMEPFFTTARDGTGLGLYIARELCAGNHARFRAENAPESGAIFRIVFSRQTDIPVTIPETPTAFTVAG